MQLQMSSPTVVMLLDGGCNWDHQLLQVSLRTVVNASNKEENPLNPQHSRTPSSPCYSLTTVSGS
jgi:hypothetical protein